jgi:hypothetical protein
MKRILVVLALVVAGGLFATSTAQAGNWEETLLDPVPARVEPGVTYTLGYWILQHGSYPFMGGDLGPTALVATVTVPGAVEIAPSEMTSRAPHEWGTVHPSFPPAAADAAIVGPGTAPDPVTTQPRVAAKGQATVDKPAKALPWTLVTLGGLATIGFAVWLGRRFARSNR